MTVYPASGLLLLIWLVLVRRDIDNSLRLSIACLPLGIFAAANLAGLSLLAAHMIALLSLLLLSLRALAAPGGPRIGPVTPATMWLLAFMAYAAVSAVVLPRIFAGQFYVFPMTVSLRGVVVSADFPSTMMPLGPTTSNLAQAGYILISGMFFMAASATFSWRGAAFARSAVFWAGLVNLGAGLLDLIGLDDLLTFIRTADYALANTHTLAGFLRVIGGFSEASVFGATSATFFAWFLMAWLTGRRPSDGFIALGSMVMALFSMSSSGMATLVAALLLTVLHARIWAGQRLSRGFLHLLVILGSGLTGTLALMAQSDALMAEAARLLDALIFDKPASLSGLERGAWAAEGFNAFWQTHGFGAGPGSLRANGLPAVLAGSVGLPGILTFGGFLLAVLAPVGRPGQPELFQMARVAALTTLFGLVLSATTPDPTLLLMSFAAIACAARAPQTGTSGRRMMLAGIAAQPLRREGAAPPIRQEGDRG
ncbi:hypothetical protein [Gemmobacter sp. 24YEA27]|uniref:hypothetical protein n=1 Tax=Gemmobacter sp. 24YEA27 TaxID=3040672 RepID=UPI0024B35537|nr:hypothetical protein [Gemmobacter sp. 24YEA27]